MLGSSTSILGGKSSRSPAWRSQLLLWTRLLGGLPDGGPLTRTRPACRSSVQRPKRPCALGHKLQARGPRAGHPEEDLAFWHGLANGSRAIPEPWTQDGRRRSRSWPSSPTRAALDILLTPPLEMRIKRLPVCSPVRAYTLYPTSVLDRSPAVDARPYTQAGAAACALRSLRAIHIGAGRTQVSRSGRSNPSGQR